MGVCKAIVSTKGPFVTQTLDRVFQASLATLVALRWQAEQRTAVAFVARPLGAYLGIRPLQSMHILPWRGS